MKNILASLAIAALAVPAMAQDAAGTAQTPAQIVENAPRDAWKPIAPENLLILELAADAAGKPREVVIRLMPPPFSQPWVDNVRTLARAHWWDGTSVYRVVENFVAQWGGGDDEEAGFPPYVLPEGVQSPLVPYTLAPPQDGRTYAHEAWPDPYAPHTGLRDGLAFGWDAQAMWPLHCYGTVAVARDMPPDTGTGAELYAVIGNAPRRLDRNLAVVGKVIAGIEHLATLPRGTGDAGVYAARSEDTPILSVRLASDLADPPRYEYLDTASESFARYAAARVSRGNDFYVAPPSREDICALPVPTRRIAD
ncbi:MAG: peptidylprolyl isomerase [Porphyrobacter sp.]|nr:peptidylprolyl isomerase [Porphyrobacter sp.]